jgi:3-deoxy-D-manno-octulosonate 8-phosphate phosphatase (KDO 8-P phosphatase)
VTERRAPDWPDLGQVHTIVFDFDGVFTDNKVYVSEEGVESVRCDRADGLGIDFLRRYRDRRYSQLKFFVVSTERNPVVEARARKLKLEVHQDVGDKLAFITAYLKRHRPAAPDPFAGLVYFGNDLNDLAVLARAGFSIVPADAHPRIREAASVVLPQNGGEGFVRAAVERLLRMDKMTVEEIHELVCNR